VSVHPFSFAECKRIACSAGAIDPMRVASVLYHATDRPDLENALRQLKANEPTWFRQARHQ
jgi:hypothetical protein